MNLQNMRIGRSVAIAAIVLALAALPVFAKGSKGPSASSGGWYEDPVDDVVWFQGFEDDAAGWLDTDDAWHGDVTRVASGTDGLDSATGDWHAIFSGNADSAPFSRFDGYRDMWPGAWAAEIKVYLDPSWLSGTGFDYSVAATGSDGNHQRDYIFHVTKDTSSGGLFVAGSNNTNFAPREDLDTLANNYEVTTAGWYTLQHVFYDDGGSLSVDLNLLDDMGNVLFTETRSDAADTIPAEVGGNRYAWFTFIDVPGGIACDDHQLYIVDGAAVRRYLRLSAQIDKKGNPKGSFKFELKDTREQFKGRSITGVTIDGVAGTADVEGTCRLGKNASPSGDDYNFRVWMTDADPDTARVKIWYVDGGSDVVVYDSSVEVALGGGSIVVRG